MTVKKRDSMPVRKQQLTRQGKKRKQQLTTQGKKKKQQLAMQGKKRRQNLGTVVAVGKMPGQGRGLPIALRDPSYLELAGDMQGDCMQTQAVSNPSFTWPSKVKYACMAVLDLVMPLNFTLFVIVV